MIRCSIRAIEPAQTSGPKPAFSALQGVTCGTTAVLTLHTADAYGNVRTAGGEVVSASHAAKGGRRGNAARVKDNGNGTYALRYGTCGNHMRCYP